MKSRKKEVRLVVTRMTSLKMKLRRMMMHLLELVISRKLKMKLKPRGSKSLRRTRLKKSKFPK